MERVLAGRNFIVGTGMEALVSQDRAGVGPGHGVPKWRC